MKKKTKKTLKCVLIITTIVLASYGTVKLYDFISQDLTNKIKKGVTQGILSTLNPLNWPGKIFGSKNK
jgi:hypothetical protein